MVENGGEHAPPAAIDRTSITYPGSFLINAGTSCSASLAQRAHLYHVNGLFAVAAVSQFQGLPIGKVTTIIGRRACRLWDPGMLVTLHEDMAFLRLPRPSTLSTWPVSIRGGVRSVDMAGALKEGADIAFPRRAPLQCVRWLDWQALRCPVSTLSKLWRFNVQRIK